MRLDDFNALPDASDVLTACCASPVWAATVADGRPYSSVDALLTSADDALTGLDEAEIDRALAGHPRIGERSAHASSQREQSGVTDDDRAALAAANRAYEERFGHVYLVCAAGRPAAELLEILRTRLHNTPEEERAVLREELRKINTLRLRHLLDGSEADSATAATGRGTR